LWQQTIGWLKKRKRTTKNLGKWQGLQNMTYFSTHFNSLLIWQQIKTTSA
jgi:hypothetical protein